MAHMLGELTNDVYDLDELGGDADFIGDDGFGFMMLGVFVSIIPKVRDDLHFKSRTCEFKPG